GVISQFSSFEIGQPAFASLARRSNSARSSPATRATKDSADLVTVKPPSLGCSVTLHSASSVPSLWPALANAKLVAIVKQAACAAAIISSALVPASYSKGMSKAYGGSNAHDAKFTRHLPYLPRPS